MKLHIGLEEYLEEKSGSRSGLSIVLTRYRHICYPNLMKLIVDVGANKGQFCIPIAQANPNHTVIAIEPVSWMAQNLRDAVLRKSLTNVIVIEAAVANRQRPAFEKIMKPSNLDWGKTSLLNHTADSDWEQEVEVRSLEDIMKPFGEYDIDFIKVDSQGMDLEVLQSLGTQISRVSAGMLESRAADHPSPAYQNEPSLREYLAFLEQSELKVYHLTPNDKAIRDVNLYFCRQPKEIDSMEQELSLTRSVVYASKYWNVNSKKQINGIASWIVAILKRILGFRL